MLYQGVLTAILPVCFIFQSVPESFSESETNEADQAAEDESQDKDSDAGSDAFEDLQTNILIEDDEAALPYDMDYMSELESQESDSEFDGGTEGDKGARSPLFLQLTCTLRDRSSHAQPMHLVSINTLPVCLGKEEVTRCRYIIHVRPHEVAFSLNPNRKQTALKKY